MTLVPVHFLLPSVFLILSLLYLLSKPIKHKSRTQPPGPPGLPLIGNLHQIDYSKIQLYLWQLSKSYGPILSLRFGFIPAIVISSADLAEQVLKHQDLIFCSRPSLLGQQKLSYNGLDVAFAPYTDYWREMRKIFTAHLLSTKSVQSFRYIREDEVSRAMKKIRELALSLKQVNLSEITMILTSAIILRVGFGNRYEAEGHERKEVVRLLNELQEMMATFYFSDLWPNLPFAGWIDKLTGVSGRLEKCFQDFDLFYQNLIDKHLNRQKAKGWEEEDIIDILLRLKKDQLLGPFQITFDHIKAVLMNVLAAGTDTSAAVVVWAMTELIKNPESMKKLQEEVRNVVGNKGEVDEEDLPKLAYLKAVVKETMRLHPPTPLLLPRETTKETVLNSYCIKPKTLVYVNAWAIGRDPKSWESPEEFSPERFLGSNSGVDFRGQDFGLIPFGGGRRGCPGISMGAITVELILSNLVYLFDWGLPDGMKKEDLECETMPGLTMHKKKPLCLLALPSM